MNLHLLRNRQSEWRKVFSFLSREALDQVTSYCFLFLASHLNSRLVSHWPFESCDIPTMLALYFCELLFCRPTTLFSPFPLIPPWCRLVALCRMLLIKSDLVSSERNIHIIEYKNISLHMGSLMTKFGEFINLFPNLGKCVWEKKWERDRQTQRDKERKKEKTSFSIILSHSSL